MELRTYPVSMFTTRSEGQSIAKIIRVVLRWIGLGIFDGCAFSIKQGAFKITVQKEEMNMLKPTNITNVEGDGYF